MHVLRQPMVLVSAVVLGLSLVSCRGFEAQPVALTSATVATRDLVGEHAALRQRLDEARGLLAVLTNSRERGDQQALMHRLVVFFTVGIGEHVRWEERALYDVVDRRIGGSIGFTTSLRREHVVMHRWIAELADLQTAEDADVGQFVGLAYELVGLAHAHLDAED